jgi:hypothetical protein
VRRGNTPYVLPLNVLGSNVSPWLYTFYASIINIRLELIELGLESDCVNITRSASIVLRRTSNKIEGNGNAVHVRESRFAIHRALESRTDDSDTTFDNTSLLTPLQQY